jgi:hypothetical protein
LEGLRSAECYELTTLPPDKKAIFAQWVLTVKTDSYGNIIKYKARCTCRGDMIQRSLNNDTSSPVASWTGIRLFLALTTLYHLTPLQLDINLAYLNAPLDDEVYMYPPPGSNTPKGLVWKLRKSLYGLRQSGRNWNKLFVNVLCNEEFGFVQHPGDPCLFTRLRGDEITIMFIYVDDVYIASSNPDSLEEFTNALQKHFDLKILGIPRQLLGVQIQWADDFKAVHLSASKLINELIVQHKPNEDDIRSTPMDPTYRQTKANSPSTEDQTKPEMIQLKQKYQELVGSYIFIMNTCRPDITYATCQLCRRMANPSHYDWQAALNLLHYLHGTVTLGIGYRSNGNRVPYLYVDSDDGADESRNLALDT